MNKEHRNEACPNMHWSTCVQRCGTVTTKSKPSRHGPHEAVGRGLTGKQNAAVMAKSANLGTKIKMWFSRCTRLRRSEDSPDKPSGRSQLRTMGGAPGLRLALALPAVVLGGDKCTKLKFGSRRRSHKSACPAAALRSKLMKGAACCSLKRSRPKNVARPTALNPHLSGQNRNKSLK